MQVVPRGRGQEVSASFGAGYAEAMSLLAARDFRAAEAAMKTLGLAPGLLIVPRRTWGLLRLALCALPGAEGRRRGGKNREAAGKARSGAFQAKKQEGRVRCQPRAVSRV